MARKTLVSMAGRGLISRKPPSLLTIALGMDSNLKRRPRVPDAEWIRVIGHKYGLDGLERSIGDMHKRGEKVPESVVRNYLAFSFRKNSFYRGWSFFTKSEVPLSSDSVTHLLRMMIEPGKDRKERIALMKEWLKELNSREMRLDPNGIEVVALNIDPIQDSNLLYDLSRELTSYGELEVKKHIRVFTTLMVGQAKSGNSEAVQEMFSELEKMNVGIVNNMHAHIALIKAHGRNMNLAGVIKACEYASKHVQFELPIYHTMMDAFLRCRQINRTLNLFEKVKNDPSLSENQVTYNIAMDAWCRSGNVEQAKELYSEMIQRKIQPRGQDMDILINGYAQQGRTEEIKAILRRKRKPPGKYAGTMLVNAYIKSGNLKEAEDHLQKAIKSMKEPVEIQARCNSLLNFYGKSREIRKMETLLAEMKRLGVPLDDFSMNTSIDAWVKNGDLSKATDLVRAMKKRGQKLDVVAYTSLIHGYGRHGQLKQAVRIFKEMSESGTRADLPAFNALVDAYVKNNELEGAERVVEEMHSAGVVGNSLLYTTIVDGCAKRGLHQKALDVLKQMRELKVPVTTATYNTLIASFSSQKDLLGAQATFIEMKQEGAAPDEITFNLLINVAAEGGDLRTVITAYEEMLARGLYNVDFSHGGLFTLAKNEEVHRQLATSSLTPASRLRAAYTSRILDSGNVPQLPSGENEGDGNMGGGSESNSKPLPIVVATRRHDDYTAKDFRKIEERGEKPSVVDFYRLILSYAKTGEFDAGIQALNEMEAEGLKPEIGIFNVLLAACTQNRDTESAIALMERRTQLQIQPTAFTYNAMMYCYALNNDVKSVMAIRKSLKRRIVPDLGSSI